MQKGNFRNIPLKNTKLLETETPVQSGLAVTPAQMLEMTGQGIPITPANLGVQYSDGVDKLTFEPPLEHTRGVDINDMWEHRERMRKKIKSPEFQKLLNTED